MGRGSVSRRAERPSVRRASNCEWLAAEEQTPGRRREFGSNGLSRLVGASSKDLVTSRHVVGNPPGHEENLKREPFQS